MQLGHTGDTTVLFGHYRALVKPADAEAYWKILPKTVATGNVIQMPVAAAS